MVLAINYAAIGVPLLSKSASIKERYKAILIKQAKSETMFKGSEDEYMLDIFRREKALIDKRMFMLNCASASIFVILASWTLFGLISRKEKK
jgi:hypothetical protein